MALLFSLASCDNGSTTNPPEKNPDGGNTSNPPDGSLKIPEDKYSVKENSDGIYFEFDVPEKTWQVRVYIDGIGQIAEEVWLNESRDKGCFFYPFLDAGKEYTIQITFLKEEDMDEDGFVINTPDQTIGYIDAKVTAGAKSKGEVRLTDKGAVEVKENGDFRFTKLPVFQNGEILNANGDWTEAVCPVEGVSWMHEGRKTKWGGEILIPQTLLAQTHNLYTFGGTWFGDSTQIGFLCCRPRMKYAYGGKEYLYQWDNVSVHDTPQLRPEAELWQTVDINNSADVNKIVGTWNWLYRWEGWYDKEETLKVKELYEEILVINPRNVTETDVSTYTKADGKAFTKDDLLKLPLSCYHYYGEKGNGIAASKVEDFEKTLDNESRVLKFEKILYEKGDVMEETFYYRIYYLDSNTTLSDNMRTITKKYSDTQAISKFAKEEYKDYSYNRTVKLFADGSTLRIVTVYKENGKTDNEWDTDYKKQ